MKTQRAVLLLGLLLLVACEKKGPPAPTVYIQEGDTYYHRAKCECLTGREVAYKEKEVKEKGYKPCVICMVTNTVLDVDYHKTAYKEQQAIEAAEGETAKEKALRQEKAATERALREEAQRRAAKELEARQEEENRIAAEEQRAAYEAQQQEEARIQFNQSITQNRKARESEKLDALNNVHTITSEDAYHQSIQHAPVQWNAGNVVWQEPPRRVP